VAEPPRSSALARVDRTTVLLNFFLLAVTVFIPFATSVLGLDAALRPAALLYGLTLTSSSIAFNLLLAHLDKTKAFEHCVAASLVRQTVGLGTYFVALLTSFVAPLLSFGLYLRVAAFFLFPRGVDTDLGREPKQR
jgi:uncharacterized membrane protein